MLKPLQPFVIVTESKFIQVATELENQIREEVNLQKESEIKALQDKLSKLRMEFYNLESKYIKLQLQYDILVGRQVSEEKKKLKGEPMDLKYDRLAAEIFGRDD